MKTNVASAKATMTMPRLYPEMEFQAISPELLTTLRARPGTQLISQFHVCWPESMKVMTPKMKTEPAMIKVPTELSVPTTSPNKPLPTVSAALSADDNTLET